MMRRLPWLLALALLTALGGTVYWLIATESGLRWAFGELQARWPQRLAVHSLQGRLIGPIELRELVYEANETRVRVAFARLEWTPSALLLGRLQIDELAADGVHVRLVPAHAEPRAPPDFALPLNVAVDALRLTDIRFERSDGSVYAVDAAELRGFLGQQIVRIERLQIDGQSFALDAAGTLGLRAGTEQRLHVDWRATLPGKRRLAATGEIRGNLDDLRIAQRVIEPITAQVSARVRGALDAPRWELRAEVPAFDPAAIGYDDLAEELALVLEARGTRRDFTASGDLEARTTKLPPLAAHFALARDADGVLTVEQLALRVEGSDARVDAQGRWQPDSQRWQATVRWQDLRWPLVETPWMASPEGRLDAEGTLAEYTFALQGATSSPHAPAAQWRARGRGDRTQLTAQHLEIEALRGTFAGSASLAWTPALRWQARLAGDGIDPGTHWPMWDGSLSLSAHASGNRTETRLTLERVHGTLRGFPLDVSASVVRRGDAFPELAASLRSGSALARVNGRLDRTWDLDWSLTAPDLRNLLPEASGALDARGRLSGPRNAPRIDARLSATRLAHAPVELAQAQAQLALDLSDASDSRVRLRVADGTLFGRAFERLAVDASGRLAAHTIAIDARLPGPSLQARLEGRFASRAWRGRIAESMLRIGKSAWRLQDSPALALAADAATLERACWRAQAANVCLALEHTRTAGLRISTAAGTLPLALFRPLFEDVAELSGTVSGEAELHFDGGRLHRANAGFDFSAGVLTPAALTKNPLRYEGATFNFVVDDAGLQARARIALPKADAAEATVALPRWHDDGDLAAQPLAGRVTLRLHDLALFDALLLQIDELRGMVDADFALEGTVGGPRLRGRVALAEAEAAIPAAGIRVTGVRFTVIADGSDKLALDGEAQSGEGRLALSGWLRLPSAGGAWSAELHATGEKFRAADLPAARVLVSPALRAQLDPKRIRVTGDVRVPQAKFALRAPRPGAIAPSPDVVIVNAPADQAPRPQWEVSAEVRVLLGDDVRFEGFGLAGKVAGDVVLIDAPNQATTARGELRVAEGEYEAYGQRLRVERGRLIFVGPVSNPGIDARAVREIENTTVGVEVKGTLRAPQLTLFSDPVMAQADVLSYLLFGRSLEAASAAEGRSLAAAARALQLAGGERLARRIGTAFGFEEVDIETGSTNGAAALVLGRQLSPRLYINYSIGLFESENVLRLRYRLTPNWSLEAQSGGTSSGGDIFYTIER